MGTDPPLPATDQDPRGPAYAAAVRIVRSGVQPGSDLWPLAVLVLFLLIPTGKGGFDPARLLGMIGAILFRDFGRWAAIHLLGYPDKSLLIFPFLRRNLPEAGDRNERYKQGLVILAGPLPGIFLAFVVALATLGFRPPQLNSVILYVVILNGFLLLPLGSFDGGRVLNLVIFSRSRIVEAVFLVLTAAALCYASFRFELYVLAIVGLLGFFNAQRRFATRRAAADFRKLRPALSGRLEDLDDVPMHELFDAAHRLAPRAAQRSASAGDARFAALYASRMREIYEDAVFVAPSLLGSLGIVALYLAGLALAAITAVLTVLGPKLHT